MAEIILQRVSYYPTFFVARIVHAIFAIIQALLAIRFLFVLFGASPASPFVSWLYDVTAQLVGPFFGAFPVLSLGGLLIELSTILAMIAYAIIGWLIIKIFSFILAGV
jgi:hypothetical protein